MHPSINSEVVFALTNRIIDLSGQAQVLRHRLESIIQFLGSRIKGQEYSFMLKNKLGMTKTDAKKMFYSYRGKKDEEDGEESDQPPDIDTTEKKIAMIMNYMEDTSQKLDRIENDIAELKSKVEQILKKI